MALVFLVAVGALLLAWRLHVRLTELETTTREERQTLRTLISDLEREVISLKKRLAGLEDAPVEPRPAAAPPPSPPLIEAKAAPATAADREPARVPPPPAVRPAEQPAPPAVPPRILARPVAPPRALAAPPAAPPPPSLAPTPPAPQAPPAAAWSFDWESLVGVKLFSWIAGIALVVAGLFFLRYSIEQGWLQPPVRMAIGIFVSLALLAVCELKAARAYPVTANALDAAAVALLFSTFYAAYALWSLIGVPLAFVLLALVAVVAVLLSIRRNSLFIALLGLVGGFATPALVSTGQDNPIGLFGYLLILNAGLSWVAYRKTWPLLVGLSLAFTTLYEWSWVMTFLTDAKLPLAVGIFLVFPVLNVLALTLGQPKPAGDQPRSLYGQLASASACLPLLFALYLAAAPAYAAHYGLLFAFLLVLDVGLFAIAITRGPGLLHLIGGSATLIILWAWLSAAYGAGQPVAAWPAMLAVVALCVAFYLTAPVIARWLGRGLTGIGSHAVLIAPLLLSAFPAFALLEPRAADPASLFLVLFGLLVAIAWAAIVTRRGALHFIAAFFALATEAVWSTLHLTPERLLAALVLYGVFGLFYLVVPLIARRGDPAGDAPPRSALFLGLVGHLFLFFVASQPQLSVPPWPLLGVLAVLDVAIGAAALYIRRGALFLAALAASQAILIVWVPVARDVPWPVVGALAACAVVALGCVWAVLVRRMSIETRLFDAAAVTAAILAQLVTLLVAAQHGSPGVPFLAATHAALIVVLLALAAYLRRHELAIAGVALPAIAVILWQVAHRGADNWAPALLFALPLYLLFAAYPLALGRRAARTLEPCQAAVLASVPFFFVARRAMMDGGLGGIIGVLPIGQAALLALLLVQLLRLERPGERTIGRLALVAGAALAFITVAIPLQLEKEWITVAWALEGAALAWLFVRIPHRGLFWSALGLLAVVFVRLALNPEVLVYQPRGALRIWNWYLYTYLVSAAAMLVAAWWLAKTDDAAGPDLPRARTLLKAGGTILLFLVLNIEIADFYATGETITFNFTATLAQDLTYTLGWAVFGVALLAAGIALRSHPARVSALGLLVVTILKCFLHDLGRLAGLFRVASFVGLAVCLALVAVVLQKFVLAKPPESRR